MRTAALLLVAVLAGCLGGDDGTEGNGTATQDPGPGPAAGIRLVEVWDGLSQPLLVTHAHDERVFVVEQGGRVHVAVDGALEPWLDVSDAISTGGERGLLGLAFPPDHEETGRFYLSYTRPDGGSVLSRWTATDRAVDEDSEEVLLTVAQPFSNHNGGHIEFGPDGYLYYGLGDGGAAGDPNNNGQNPTTLLGSILRLDVSGASGYAVPEDNPFVGEATGADEVWAYGLRNPWRFHFDADTGDLWIGDVGQDCWEEIDHQPAASEGGENYGWNRFEGSHAYAIPADAACVEQAASAPNYTYPVAEYRNGAHCSVTGGTVYRGGLVPDLDGAYVFGDYCTGQLWTLRPDGDGFAMEELMETALRVSSFGTDAAGSLYVVDHQGGAVHAFASE